MFVLSLQAKIVGTRKETIGKFTVSLLTPLLNYVIVGTVNNLLRLCPPKWLHPQP